MTLEIDEQLESLNRGIEAYNPTLYLDPHNAQTDKLTEPFNFYDKIINLRADKILFPESKESHDLITTFYKEVRTFLLQPDDFRMTLVELAEGMDEIILRLGSDKNMSAETHEVLDQLYDGLWIYARYIIQNNNRTGSIEMTKAQETFELVLARARHKRQLKSRVA